MIIASMLAIMSPGFCIVLWAFFGIEEQDEMFSNMLFGASWVMIVGLFYAIAATI